MKIREVLRLLRDDGWVLWQLEGAIVNLSTPTKLGRVTVAGKPNDDLGPGTLSSILKQAGLEQ